MRYLPHTDEDRAAMLAAIGVKSADDLFVDVPKEISQEAVSELPKGLTEMSVEARTVKLADRLDNVRDLETMSESFIARYVPESRALVEKLRGTNGYLEAAITEILDRFS